MLGQLFSYLHTSGLFSSVCLRVPQSVLGSRKSLHDDGYRKSGCGPGTFCNTPLSLLSDHSSVYIMLVRQRFRPCGGGVVFGQHSIASELVQKNARFVSTYLSHCSTGDQRLTHRAPGQTFLLGIQGCFAQRTLSEQRAKQHSRGVCRCSFEVINPIQRVPCSCWYVLVDR